MVYFLTLVFTCGVGCGYPSTVTLPMAYGSQGRCIAAGRVWLSAAANPDKAVRDFTCDQGNRLAMPPG